MGQLGFRCYVTPDELESVIISAEGKFNLRLMGKKGNEMEDLQESIHSSLRSIDYLGFALSTMGSSTDAVHSWKQGDLHFGSIYSRFGYQEMFQLFVYTERRKDGGRLEPINFESGRLFRFISRELTKISRKYWPRMDADARG